MPQTKKTRLSRTAIKDYLKCQRCFYFERFLKIKAPAGPPFTLNLAVDTLVKREFDIFRAKEEVPVIFKEQKIAGRLYPGLTDNPNWRANFVGVTHMPAGMEEELFGAVDDIWEYPDGALAVIDYKATGANSANIYPDYQHQMDVYTYLLEANGFTTHRDAYFLYFIADKANDRFDKQLTFREELIKIDTNPENVERDFREAVELMKSGKIPAGALECEMCAFVKKRGSYK